MRSEILETTINGRTYQIENPLIQDGLKATVTVLDTAGALVASDRLNLDRAKARSAFADAAGIPADDLLTVRSAVAEWLVPPLDMGTDAPAGEPRPLATLLDEVSDLLGEFVVLSDAQKTALALWVAHSHAFDAADATPYLAITSPEKRSGKTRLLEVLELLVNRTWLTGRTTAAALARKVDKHQPTLLLDESDAAFKGEKEYAETLRGVLNTGHRRGGNVTVCVGQGADMDVRDFSTFGAKAIAGIGTLPDTVSDRSIPIRMQRKRPGESVARFRRRDVEATAKPLQQELTWWSNAAVEALRDARPDLPVELDDRAADGWEPLLAIADVAGNEWPERARASAVELSTGVTRADDSLGVKLLTALQEIFEGHDRLPTFAIISRLNARDNAPWGGFHDGAGMRPRDLANILRRYDVEPRNVRMPDGSVPKGYVWQDVERVCVRYVPDNPLLSATSASTSQKQAEIIRYTDPKKPSCSGLETPGFPHLQANVADVADKRGLSGHTEEKQRNDTTVREIRAWLQDGTLATVASERGPRDLKQDVRTWLDHIDDSGRPGEYARERLSQTHVAVAAFLEGMAA